MTRTLRGALIAALGIGWLALAVWAQTDDIGSKVDNFVNSSIRQQKIPGLALAVLRDGQIIKAQGYGLGNIELNVPASPQTVFQSGSVGKKFTATGVMMLVEEGKVGLDDKITKYFPGAPETWNKITIRHLLTHTSGIKDYTHKNIDFRRDYTEEELLKVLQ